MKFSPIVIALATVLGLGAASAQADYRPGFPDKARVISSTPVYDRINEPRQQCWTETVGYDEQVYRSSSPRQVEHCKIQDNFRDVAVGYDVVYQYRGQQYSTRMAYDLGRWLEVNVDVSRGPQTPYFRNPYSDN